MPVEVRPFDPVSAPEAELVASYAVMSAVQSLDHPEQKLPTLEQYIELISAPTSLAGPMRRWLALEDSRVVGHASAIYPEHENRHMTIVRIVVTPERRRRGVGTALLRAILPDLGADGRTVVAGHGVKADASGEQWARALGFVRTHGFIRQILKVADVDQALWQHPVADGFRLERWIGAAPETCLAAYARARTAIADAPSGESTMAHRDWTPERVRVQEETMRAGNWGNRVVVAVHEASGEVAAITELSVRAEQPTRAFQGDTAVVAEFRGRGLGLAVKGAMLRWLTADRPEVEHVHTQTAHDNVHMARINFAVGFTTDAALSELEADLGDLVKRLAAE
ncbi:mycothiol synthase [Catenulispora sp. GP43]|uniref:GNAT family N-acetyltransferase n=1 Tax=Catenulispora sp. GP43 TaxID=3156263 RepID=UPI0035155622